jgi:hypothetical protein
MIPMSKLTPAHGEVLLRWRGPTERWASWYIGKKLASGRIRVSGFGEILDENFSGWTHIPKLPSVEKSLLQIGDGATHTEFAAYCADGRVEAQLLPVPLVQLDVWRGHMTASEARSFAYAILAVCDAMEGE